MRSQSGTHPSRSVTASLAAVILFCSCLALSDPPCKIFLPPTIRAGSCVILKEDTPSDSACNLLEREVAIASGLSTGVTCAEFKPCTRPWCSARRGQSEDTSKLMVFLTSGTTTSRRKTCLAASSCPRTAAPSLSQLYTRFARQTRRSWCWPLQPLMLQPKVAPRGQLLSQANDLHRRLSVCQHKWLSSYLCSTGILAPSPSFIATAPEVAQACCTGMHLLDHPYLSERAGHGSPTP